MAAMARNAIRRHASPKRCPSEVLRRVNAELFADLDGRSFVAVSYALVDLATCRVRLARAGLAAPVLMHASRGLEPLDCEGMVMGIDEGPIFDSSLQVRAFELDLGQLLVMYTSGVIEARGGESREEFGLERTHRMIERYGTHEVDYFVDKFREHFGSYVRGRPSSDACLVALKRAENGA
jgi:serine phosphatase RsbU (regulator of sigma subunit)